MQKRSLKRKVGFLWIMRELARLGQSKGSCWWPDFLPYLRELGYVQPSVRHHKHWELTQKGNDYYAAAVSKVHP